MTMPATPRSPLRSRLAALGAAVFCVGLCGAAALFLLSDAQVLELTRSDGALVGRVRSGGAEAVLEVPMWRWVAERAVDGCLALGGALWALSAAAGAAGRLLSNLRAGGEGRG